jgi:ABC-2 type transport system ATP-binding protein
VPDFILTADDLHKSYGANAAVQGISFGIQRGEVFSLLGPNGAGKTTTIAMLSCLLAPTQGDATIDGHSIRREPGAVKRVIGVVPQDIALYRVLSARENLLFWGQMYGLGGARLRRRWKKCWNWWACASAADRIEDLFLRHAAPHQPAGPLISRSWFMDEPPSASTRRAAATS